MLTLSLPATWVGGADVSTGTLGGLAVVACVLAWTLISRRPVPGVVGAVVLGAAVGGCLDGTPGAGHWGMSSALVFLLAHSCFWGSEHAKGATALRFCAAGIWVLQSFIWMAGNGDAWMTCVFAAIVLAISLAVRLLRGWWDQLLLAAAALLVMLTGPGHSFVTALAAAPAGLVAIVASFLLFAIGTAGALTKHRWQPASSAATTDGSFDSEQL
jgi:hypothetical protein